jgi:predicted DNA repair protein MutK
VLTGIAILMTVGVYGLVAGIVKLDDGGLYFSRRDGDSVYARMQRRIGEIILKAAPWLMKGLSVAGTAAMFLVGGSILTHGVPPLHHFIESMAHGMAALPGVGGAIAFLAPILLDGVVGIAAGALVLGVVSAVQRVLRPRTVEP